MMYCGEMQTCKAVLQYPTGSSFGGDQEDDAVMEGVTQWFQKQLNAAHGASCPWRTVTCSVSLLQFPSMPQSSIAADFRDRARELRNLLCLPPISEASLAEVFKSSSSQRAQIVLERGDYFAFRSKSMGQTIPETTDDIRQELVNALTGGVASCFEAESFLPRVYFLALCGWNLRILKASGERDTSHQPDMHSIPPENASLQCSLCGAKIGLWTFFDGCTAKVFDSKTSISKNKNISMYQKNKSPFSANHQVATNMATTIAGGMFRLHAEVTTDGPFGKKSTAPLFTPKKDLIASNVEEERNPRKEKRKRLEPMEASTDEKRQKQKASRADRSASTALARYRNTCTSPIDPLWHHRSFCSWINDFDMDGSDVKCGWQMYADNLVLNSPQLGTSGGNATGSLSGRDVYHKILASVSFKK